MSLWHFWSLQGEKYRNNYRKRFTIIRKMVDLFTGYIFFLKMSKNVIISTIYCGEMHQKTR